MWRGYCLFSPFVALGARNYLTNSWLWLGGGCVPIFRISGSHHAQMCTQPESQREKRGAAKIVALRDDKDPYSFADANCARRKGEENKNAHSVFYLPRASLSRVLLLKKEKLLPSPVRENPHFPPPHVFLLSGPDQHPNTSTMIQHPQDP